MATYFTSDLHFGHKNIIDFCNRPYSSVEEMNEALVENWNSTVSTRDIVYVLGDVAMGRKEETLPICRRLNGNKYLVPGNHDSCWRGHKKWMGAVDQYIRAGFTILPGQLDMYLHGKYFVACHFPYGSTKHDERYAANRPEDKGSWLLHGHVHDAWKVNGRQINVGVDVWDMSPVSWETLEEIMN